MTVGRRLKDIHRYSLRVIGNFDRPSTERLMSSIGTAALARTSSSPENQLISLWSSIEVLLSEPPQNTARIAHYVSLLVPCICLRHIRRQFVALFDELLISYRSRFSKLVRGGPRLVPTDSHTNFAALMLLDEAAPLRTELMGLCAANPLALHRLWKINRDHRTLRDSMKTIRDHERRVDWQLHRIYRARNNLVHAGRMPSYFKFFDFEFSGILSRRDGNDCSPGTSRYPASIRYRSDRRGNRHRLRNIQALLQLDHAGPNSRP